MESVRLNLENGHKIRENRTSDKHLSTGRHPYLG